MNLEKLEKALGIDTVKELEALDVLGLKDAITQAEMAVKLTKEELEANPKFQEIKASAKALSAGLNDVKKRQKAKVQLCLHLLEQKGQ